MATKEEKIAALTNLMVNGTLTADEFSRLIAALDGSVAAPAAPAPVDRSAEIEKFLDLAVKGIQGQNSDQVEKYCQSALEIDPNNSRAWELEARGLLFQSSLKDNKIIQAVSAAANAVSFAEEDKKAELAVSLYDSIYPHITGLLNIAIGMPTMYAPNYVAQCMNYDGVLISGIPGLPKEKIQSELAKFDQMDADSKKAIMPKKRMIYASHVMKPTWADQYRALLQQKGML